MVKNKQKRIQLSTYLCVYIGRCDCECECDGVDIYLCQELELKVLHADFIYAISS